MVLRLIKVNPISLLPLLFYLLIYFTVYDNGTCFSPAILDITEDDLRARLLEGVRNIASVSLQIGYPTVASVPHSIINGFKNVLAIAAQTEITFPEAEQVRSLIQSSLISFIYSNLFSDEGLLG